MNIERFVNQDGQPRYRLLFPGEHSAYDGENVTATPQDLREISDWCQLHMRELEAEARIADTIARNQAMELAPNEIEAEQEDELPDRPLIDWRALEKQVEQDVAAIVTDQDAYRFIERYLSADLRGRYIAIYRSDRHEMNRSPQQAIKNLLSLPPLE
jgi:hypothetical protein